MVESTGMFLALGDITGKRVDPMGVVINQTKADKAYDFVRLRLRWHPEMMESASNLDKG